MRLLARLVLGYVIWAALFIAVYALQATGCALTLPPATLRALLIGLHAAGIVAGLVVVLMALRERGPWRLALIAVSASAAGASLLTSSGLLWMRLC